MILTSCNNIQLSLSKIYCDRQIAWNSNPPCVFTKCCPQKTKFEVGGRPSSWSRKWFLVPQMTKIPAHLTFHSLWYRLDPMLWVHGHHRPILIVCALGQSARRPSSS